MSKSLTTWPAALPSDSGKERGLNSFRQLYEAMLHHGQDSNVKQASREWLDAKLEASARQTCELPPDPAALYAWMESNLDAVGERYQHYLRRRKNGGAREMFSNRSHALFFLAQVAPTKLVDGSWLFGSLRHHADARFQPLISTYLEELGMGDEAQNHVNLFSRLLRATGADGWEPENDVLYEQGAVQLALGLHGHELVPEMVGFNLGYEQLPYHLHVTGYELNELGIDPYYFTVHVTVDNAASGHAKQAIDAVIRLMPDDRVEALAFYERVKRGFMLNDVGVSSTSIAASFEPRTVVNHVFQKKARYGRAAHADYCRIGGRTVNEWLFDPASVPGFVDELEARGWIRRHEDPRKSRFWGLLAGSDASMFGVFNAFELQLIYDWIAGDCPEYLPGPELPDRTPRPMARGRHLEYRLAKQLEHRSFETPRRCAPAPHHGALALLAPGAHHTEEGRAATKAFAQSFNSVDTIEDGSGQPFVVAMQ